MPDTRGLLRNGDFIFEKTYYYSRSGDMVQFEGLTLDPDGLVIAVDYHDDHVVVLIRAGW
jgi:hypothetical protein